MVFESQFVGFFSFSRLLKVGYQSSLAATCPVTMFPHFSIKYSLNTMQNTHKEVCFTKGSVDKKTLKRISCIFSLCSCLTNIGWILQNFFLSSLINCSITSAQIKIYFPHNSSPDGEGNLNQIVTNLPSKCIFLKGPFSYRQNWALGRNCSSSYTKREIFP